MDGHLSGSLVPADTKCWMYKVRPNTELQVRCIAGSVTLCWRCQGLSSNFYASYGLATIYAVSYMLMGHMVLARPRLLELFNRASLSIDPATHSAAKTSRSCIIVGQDFATRHSTLTAGQYCTLVMRVVGCSTWCWSKVRRMYGAGN